MLFCVFGQPEPTQSPSLLRGANKSSKCLYRKQDALAWVSRATPLLCQTTLSTLCQVFLKDHKHALNCELFS